MKITKTTHILFIALIIVVVFSPSLKSEFVWDDQFLILNNPYVKGWDHIPDVFSKHLYEGGEMESNFYRPVQLLSYMIDYSLWGLRPFGYHLTSLLLHSINTALVYIILFSISSSPALAFLTALFFAVASAISGTTYYIAARSDLLMALFLFSSFLFFSKSLQSRKKFMHVISVFLFMLSLLCKEMAIALPLLLILELWRRKEKIKRSFNLLLPYFITVVLFAVSRLSVLNFSEGANNINYPASIPLWRRILTDFKVILGYLKILIFPYDLHMERFIEPARTIFQIDILASIAFLAFLVFIIVKLARTYRLVLFGAAWFLASLLPVLNIYPVSVFSGDGWLYVPSVGFFIIFSIILIYIVRPRIGRLATASIIVGLIVYFSIFTISHGMTWKDNDSLYNNILKYEEENPFIYLTHINLAGVYYNKGEFKKAIESSKKAIMLNPKHAWRSYTNLASAYMAIGRPIKAIGHFKRAIKLKKDYVIAYCFLAHGYSEIGLEDRALEFSNIALGLDPDSYDANCNLGYLYSDKGEIDKAKTFYKKAARLKEGSREPHLYLGNLYMLEGEYENALREYEEALRLGLADYTFYNTLSGAYMKNKRYREAEEMLMKSIALNSDQSEAHNDLGNLYSMLGHLELAIQEYKKAFKADPDNEGIRDNLKKTRMVLEDAI
ncbi:MAG: tetratricopeptide repeat protein [Candidatus Omnitrophica bacterium]|nr:tetratricopeptide repeat protein [Candidatus Omnitrophota bacterium]